MRHALDEIGATVYGFRDGWRGVMEGTADELTRDDVRASCLEGTILGTSRMQPFRTPDGIERVRETTGCIGSTGTSRSAARAR